MLSINADTLGKFLTTLVASAFLALGVFYFNDAESFTHLFYLILLFSIFLCRKQPDIRGVIGIILLVRLSEEIVWFILIDYDSKLLLLPIYLALAVGIWYLADEKQTKIPLRILMILILIAEVYWHFSGYKAPIIYPYLVMIVLNLTIQWLIFIRAIYGFKYKFLGKETKLDFKIYKLVRWTIFLEMAMICEYLVRHILGINMLLVYQAFPYISHMLSVYTLYLVFTASYQQFLPKKITA